MKMAIAFFRLPLFIPSFIIAKRLRRVESELVFDDAGRINFMGKIQQNQAVKSDGALFAEMAKKQSEALSALYDRHAARLYGLALKILKDPALAEDVLQDLFLYLWQNAEKFEARRGQPLAWMMILCRNRAIDKLRAREKRQSRSAAISDQALAFPAADESESPFAIVHSKETFTRITAALDSLPSEQRTPIELAFFGGLSQTEIAENLQLPLGTIKTRIRLGMQKLSDLLKEMS
jgi:RNA polymerase sigma-70 factor (ECF subfamily)